MSTTLDKQSNSDSYFNRPLSHNPANLSPALSRASGRPSWPRRSSTRRQRSTELHNTDMDSDVGPVIPAIPAISVLLVDDNPINLNLLEQSIRSIKHPYKLATNGVEAVDAYKAMSPSFPACIFMDLQMPYMSGLEATREIRRWEAEQKLKKTIVIALTANTSDSTRYEAFSAGMDLFITKPVALRKLKALMRDMQARGRDALKGFDIAS